MKVSPKNTVIGAEIQEVSLAEIPAKCIIERIESALEKYGVLIFPDQNISPRQLIEFSAALGPLEKTELEKARLDRFEEIFVVGNVGKGLVSFSPKSEKQELEWHTDHIHHKVAARASLLYAKEVPSVGGDTLFSCMYHAYDTLTDDQKQQYCEIQTINSASGLEHYLAEQDLGGTNSSAGKRKFDEVCRPLVREHPLSGRRALYFGNQITTGLVGWDRSKARDFIRTLTRHACQSAFQYRHQWCVGDAVLWDNRRVLHAGTAYDVVNERRLMHRTTLKETFPITKVQNKEAINDTD